MAFEYRATRRYEWVGMTDPGEIAEAMAAGLDSREVGEYYAAGVRTLAEMLAYRARDVDGALLLVAQNLGLGDAVDALGAVSMDPYLLRRLWDHGVHDPEALCALARHGLTAGDLARGDMLGIDDVGAVARLHEAGLLVMTPSVVRHREWRWRAPGIPDLDAMIDATPPMAAKVRAGGSMIALCVRDGYRLDSLDGSSFVTHGAFGALGGDDRIPRVDAAWRAGLVNRAHGFAGDLPEKVRAHHEAARRALVGSVWLDVGDWRGYLGRGRAGAGAD